MMWKKMAGWIELSNNWAVEGLYVNFVSSCSNLWTFEWEVLTNLNATFKKFLPRQSIFN